MLCQVCQKNDAVVTYTEIVNGVKNEKHICQECANKYTGFGGAPFIIGNSNLLSSLLASVLGHSGNNMSDSGMKKSNIICPSCGMTYNEFLKYSKYGCVDCFKTFSPILESYLKKIQGSCEHTGKVPYKMKETVVLPGIEATPKTTSETVPMENKELPKIELLKQQLQQAIADEAYEEAAKLRDQIKVLKEEAK